MKTMKSVTDSVGGAGFATPVFGDSDSHCISAAFARACLHSKRGMTMKTRNLKTTGLMLAVLFLFCLLYLPLSFANTYSKGSLTCDDFQKSEKLYNSESDIGGHYAAAYAICLLARGGEDVRAVSILERAANHDNSVPAAHFLAKYLRSGGKWNAHIERNNLNEALQAYAKVLHLIEIQGDYPEGFVIELSKQYELNSYLNLANLSFEKYLAGLIGTHNAHLLQSPTYEGEWGRDLDLYPEHSPYTLDSLERTIERGEICASLLKKAYYQSLYYSQATEYCKMTKRIAEELLPLERERLTLLEDQSCAQDVEQCSEYQEVSFEKIKPLVQKFYAETKRIFDLDS